MVESESDKNGRGWNALDQHVGLRLKGAREARKLTRKALAESLGISPRQLTKMEQGQARIAASHLYRAAKFLGVEISYYYEDAPLPSSESENVALPSGKVDQQEVDTLQRLFLSIPDDKARKNLLAMVKAAALSRI